MAVWDKTVIVSDARHKTMSRIKSKDTRIELLLRKALWHEGIRYMKNYPALPGNPDIAITRYKIAIFCDGEFWHGKNWAEKRKKINGNKKYWVSKIERNISRDNAVEQELFHLGWVVLRFWGEEIKKNLPACVWEVKEQIIKSQCEEIEMVDTIQADQNGQQ
ncbi:MAG: very short patch repair endonuclease [Treponema sp.]|jgi:DNA mismatch endonuclease (patch repair protein)|nr:very short patch repair endonuclease [Treponema sp.]